MKTFKSGRVFINQMLSDYINYAFIIVDHDLMVLLQSHQYDNSYSDAPLPLYQEIFEKYLALYLKFKFKHYNKTNILKKEKSQKEKLFKGNAKKQTLFSLRS